MASDPRRIDQARLLSLPLGSHVPMRKPDGLLGSVRFALNQRATAAMVFLGAPRSTRPTPDEDLFASEALKLWTENGRRAADIAVHFRYVLNPSSPEEETRQLAAACLDRELAQMERAGLSLLCLHPGSSRDENRQAGAQHCAETLRPVIARHPGIRVGIENLAGRGSEIGVGMVEIGLLLKMIDLPNCGFTLDTCHLWDSGFDLADRELLLATLERNIGLDKLFLIHLNDSLNPRGSNRDRHAPLGQGFIGFNALAGICGDERLWSIPKILETPDPGDGSAHAAEIALLRKGIGLL